MLLIGLFGIATGIVCGHLGNWTWNCGIGGHLGNWGIPDEPIKALTFKKAVEWSGYWNFTLKHAYVNLGPAFKGTVNVNFYRNSKLIKTVPFTNANNSTEIYLGSGDHLGMEPFDNNQIIEPVGVDYSFSSRRQPLVLRISRGFYRQLLGGGIVLMFAFAIYWCLRFDRLRRKRS
ncbi:MAG: hypothetical protein ACYS8W_16530 [Planctomycetota bacterium]